MRPIDAVTLKAEFTGNFQNEYTKGEIHALIDLAPTINDWIKCTPDTMPKSGKHVFATCEIVLLSGCKKRYVCEAFHADKYSISEGKYPEDVDYYDYCEEDDEYYLKEGWYEIIHNWDEYSSVVIDDFVTHWMRLPEPPEEDTAE